MKYVVAFIFCVLPISTFAVEYPSMKEFYKEPENLRKLSTPEMADYLHTLKDNMVNACIQKNDEKTCDCVTQFLDTNVSNEELYYESVIANQIFQDKLNAHRAKDEEKLNQLRAYAASRNSLDKKIIAACPDVKVK